MRDHQDPVLKLEDFLSLVLSMSTGTMAGQKHIKILPQLMPRMMKWCKILINNAMLLITNSSFNHFNFNLKQM